MTIKGLIQCSSIKTVFSTPRRLATSPRYFSVQQRDYVFDFKEPHLRLHPTLQSYPRYHQSPKPGEDTRVASDRFSAK
jgi:hypothetical protein